MWSARSIFACHGHEYGSQLITTQREVVINQTYGVAMAAQVVQKSPAASGPVQYGRKVSLDNGIGPSRSETHSPDARLEPRAFTLRTYQIEN